MNGVHENVSCDFPIIIGTIPFTDDAAMTTIQIMPMVQFNPSQTMMSNSLQMPAVQFEPSQATTSHSLLMPGPPSNATFANARINPPTYEEATSVMSPQYNDSDDENEYVHFSPQYPTYNFNSGPNAEKEKQ
jgi:hypothetical protein